ncbi:MAG: PP2C family protein-serine/threonine phosphatase [bacterium]|nr:PP2C family protein-serine/threonine phosphatase [bacterium]
MSLFKQLDDHLGGIEHSEDVRSTLSAFIRALVAELGGDLGISRARIYAKEQDEYVLVEEFPGDEGHTGIRIPISYEPVQELLTTGFVLHYLGDPGVDQQLEATLGVSTFAAIRIFDGRHLIAFSLLDSSNRDHTVFTLNTIRHVVNLSLRKQRLEDRVAQTRAIQQSLIPERPPVFAGYDMWGATTPAEEVGGDLYDFILLSERSMAVAVADSAGHGLPAALQARDAIIGLRMGVEEQLRITATVEKLNRVVGHSALSSRFISLFYCEVEPNGTLVYCNAGHNPPLLLRNEEFFELRCGGMILGPNPDARYERGYMLMEPGSILLLYTDGIVEAEDAQGEAFGLQRLRDVCAAKNWTVARELVDEVFRAVRGFASADPPLDDQTVVAVIRDPDSSAPTFGTC